MSKKIIKPRRLQRGDTVGIVSASSPLASLVPHRVKKGIETLKNLGFNVVIGKNALKATGHTAGTPQERAQDINNFFKDENIKAILTFIGGNHSNQLLPYLDFDAIKKNPKVFMGYSDTTVLHLALHTQLNLVTFYGPAVLTQFAENPTILPYTYKYFEKATAEDKPIGKIKPAESWTDETLDWFKKADLVRPRKFKKNQGWKWLKKGKARGILNGGCISSLIHLRGTPFWPDFTKSVFFWESPEGENFSEGESLGNIDAYLTDLKLSGVFNQINGMIIGRPYGYTSRDRKRFIEIVKERTKHYSFPILYNADFGHTDPIVTLPIGVEASIDSEDNLLSVDEEAVL